MQWGIKTDDDNPYDGVIHDKTWKNYVMINVYSDTKLNLEKCDGSMPLWIWSGICEML